MKRLRNRLLGLLLALIMLLNLFPVSALAALTPAQEVALYEYMLSIGMVDADGALIEDTRFVLESGDELNSITELRAVLADPATDRTQTAKVYGLGGEATLDELAAALEIEDFMADISARLMSRAAQSAPAAAGSASAAAPVFHHDARVRVTFGQTIKEETDYSPIAGREVVFTLADAKTGSPLTEGLPYDVSFTYEHLAGSARPDEHFSLNGHPVRIKDTVTIPQGQLTASAYIEVPNLYNQKTGQHQALEGNHYMGETYGWLGEVTTFLHLTDPVNIRFYESEEKPTLRSMLLVNKWETECADFLAIPTGNGQFSDSLATKGYTQPRDENSNFVDKYVPLNLWETLNRSFAKNMLDLGLSPTLEATVTWDEGFVENASKVDYAKIQAAGAIRYAQLAFSSSTTGEDMMGFKQKLTSGQAEETTSSTWDTSYQESWIHSKTNDSSQPQRTLLSYSLLSSNPVLPQYIIMKLNGPIMWVNSSSEQITCEHCNFNNITSGVEASPEIVLEKIEFKDYVAPTVESVEVPTDATFYPGDQVPIVVTFSEPVVGIFALRVVEGNDLLMLLAEEAQNVRANKRTFLYTVKEFDNTFLQLKSLDPSNIKSEDALGCRFERHLFNDQQIAEGQLVSALAENGVTGLSLTADNFIEGTESAALTVNLKQDEQYQQVWNSLGKPGNPEIWAILDGDTSKRINLVLPSEGETFQLSGTVGLTGLAAGAHKLELMIQYPGKDRERIIGLQKDFSITEVVNVPEADVSFHLVKGENEKLDIAKAENWPSGAVNTVYPMDKTAARLGYTYTESATKPSYTTGWYWESSDPAAADILNGEGTAGIIQPKGTGKVTISLKNPNGTPDKKDDTVIKSIAIELPVDTRPGLNIVEGGNVFQVGKGQACTLSWANTLADSEPQNGQITLKLYAGEVTDFTGQTALNTYHTDRKATSYQIPGDKLTNISVGDTPAYTVQLSATANGKEVSTVAYIVVRSLPAKVRLSGTATEKSYFAASDGPLRVDWEVTDFDTVNANDRKFQFTVTKNGEAVKTTDDPGAGADATFTGGYSLALENPADGALRDVYVIEARAKNGSDPTWSYDSRTLYVYRSDALDIRVDGESADAVTLKNKVRSSGDGTRPTITNTAGTEITDLSTAAQIAALRGKLGLNKTISINYSDYPWSGIADTVQWSIPEQDSAKGEDEVETVLTLNYRQGSLHEDINHFTFESYTPDTQLMLSGLKDGQRTVTARHSRVEGLSDRVTVTVERLYEQLYLFQFAPGATTELTYTTNKGDKKTVSSNSDGSLALYEPDGIQRETLLHAKSQSSGQDYLGTFSSSILLSGERDGASLQLYPLNTLELRPAAHAEISISKPDGTAYANAEVTLRGGVYRNGEYCESAKFAKEGNTTANLSGLEDQTFTTDGNGVLHVWMDITQFSAAGQGAVKAGDMLQFIFELQFGADKKEYYPAVVYVDGSLSPRDSMRMGANLLTLQSVEPGMENQPFVAVQTVDYGTGRQISVNGSTSYVGPSANYPNLTLHTTAMLWNVDLSQPENQNRHFGIEMQDEFGASPQEQTNEIVTYPFSSFALLMNDLKLNASKLWWEDRAKTNRQLRMQIYELAEALQDGAQQSLREAGRLLRDIPMKFKVVDMKSVTENTPIQKDANVLSVMSNLEAWGQLYGADSSSGIVNKISDAILNGAIGFITKMGAETGTIKAVLQPTSDPTVYTGYFWTGMNTTQFGDLHYDNNFHFEGSAFIMPDEDGRGYHFNTDTVEINDTLTVSDFISMANGSYLEERSSIYETVSGVIGLPIMFQAEGWLGTEIRYNPVNMQWEVLLTDGGFTAGGMMEHEFKVNVKIFTASLKIKGGAQVDMAAALRYAEQLGLEWNDETARYVNDYLTTLRLAIYFDAFAGIGQHTKKYQAKIGLFGTCNIDLENRFLTRKYLKQENLRDLRGQYLEVNGSIGVRASAGFGPFLVEFTMASFDFRDGFFFNQWKQIQNYWDKADSGTGARSLQRAPATLVNQTVRLQPRDYLDEGERQWTGGVKDRPSLLRRIIVDGPEDMLAPLETNAYPYSNPKLSDDGQLLAYLSDAGSDQVSDVEVRFSKAENNGQFPDGSVIPDGAMPFTGWGDSALDLDGTSSFAAASWVRQNHNLHGALAGSEVSEAQQAQILNGQEIVASIWNGSSWTTTRITDNSIPDTMPIVAAAGGKAILVWCTGSEVQQEVGVSEDMGVQDRILYKIYDGSNWGDTCTLYNGTEGTVKELDAELLDDGTAAVAYTLDTGLADDPDTDITESGYEMCYAVLDTATSADAPTRVTRLTNDRYEDSYPVLATTAVDGEPAFVLGWHSKQSASGVELHDLRLALFGKDGAPQANFPDSLSDMVSTAGFNGQFAFAKGTASLTELSVVWNASGAGKENNDVLRAVKFGKYGEQYGMSAPIELAAMPANTAADHFDVFAVPGQSGMKLKAALLGTETKPIDKNDPSTFDTVEVSDGGTQTAEVKVPKTQSQLFTALETFTDNFSIASVGVDYNNLSLNTALPVSFVVTNEGLHTLEKVEVQFGSEDKQTFENLGLLPGRSVSLPAIHMVGDTAANADYAMTAHFSDGAAPIEKTGVVYLDYPDVGISNIALVKEQNGERTVNLTLYDQAAAALHKTDGSRRVVLEVFTDSDGAFPVDGKYFDGGTEGTPYQVVIGDETRLNAIDSGAYTLPVTFHIGDYVKNELGKDEIPNGGVTLFFRASIQDRQSDGGASRDAAASWLTLPEADSGNNQKAKTFDSLLARSSQSPISLSMIQGTDASGKTTASVSVQNNTLSTRTSGNIIATLLDADGKVLETKQSYPDNPLALGAEGLRTANFTFTQTGAQVLASYGDVVLDNDNANLSTVSLGGSTFPVTGESLSLPVSPGSYTLTLTPENPASKIKVNGADAPQGVTSVTVGQTPQTVAVLVTAPDGSTAKTYTLTLGQAQDGGSGGDSGSAGGSGGGSASVKPTLTHNSGGKVTVASDNKTVTITPDAGYEAASVTVNGKKLDLESEALEKLENGSLRYTFARAAAGNTIEVVFQKIGETAWNNPFADVKANAWYYDAVQYVHQNGLFAGTSETTFEPELTMTRAMLVTVLHRLAGTPAPKEGNPFTDVPAGTWYTDAVLWAAENGIVTGYGGGLFGPNDRVTREQMAVILYRYAQHRGDDVRVDEDTDLRAYADYDEISSYAIPALQWACGAGVMNGKGGGRLAPKGEATRAEVAAMLMRLPQPAETDKTK